MRLARGITPLPCGNDDGGIVHHCPAMMLATGAGAQSRRIIGTTVFSGMLVATVVGILFIPALFVLFQRLREWGHSLTDSSPTARSASEPEK